MTTDLFDSIPIAPNPGQQNFDKLQNEMNRRVIEDTYIPPSPVEGRPFCTNNHDIFGYTGVIVEEGQVIALINLKQNPEIPTIQLGDIVLLKGDSEGYIPSGHKPGQRVEVVELTEPFLKARVGSIIFNTSDKIIKVSGEGRIGWIKPSNVDKEDLRGQKDAISNQLFSPEK